MNTTNARALAALALGLTLALAASAQEAPVALDQADARKAQERYHEAVEKATERYQKDLAKAHKKAQKAGRSGERLQIEAEQARVADLLRNLRRGPDSLPITLPQDPAEALAAWERLEGIVVRVPASARSVTVPRLRMRPGLILQVIPRPGDTWQTAKGGPRIDPLIGDLRYPEEREIKGSQVKGRLMQLVLRLGPDTFVAAPGEVQRGSGELRLHCLDEGVSDNVGEVTVKVMVGRPPR